MPKKILPFILIVVFFLIVLLSNGNIVKDGSVEEVITEENLNNVFGIKTKVYYNEISKSLDFCII